MLLYVSIPLDSSRYLSAALPRSYLDRPVSPLMQNTTGL